MPHPLGALFQLGPFFIPGLKPRYVRVFIPPEARYRDRPPATLFLFDGQNVFDDAPSFVGGWRLHETVGKLSLRRHRRPILVGIDHGHEDRIKELSPWPTRHGPGHADLLIGWICGELAPFLARELGLALTPANVAIGGSSMGGLAALHAHFTRPELFGAVLSMSPSLWLGEGRIFQELAARPRPLTSTIYLDAGGRESGGKMLEAASHLAGTLHRRGYGPDALLFRADRRGAHNELAWRRRTPGALRFLFANRPR